MKGREGKNGFGKGGGVERGWIICFCSVPIEAGQVLLTVESFGDRYVLFHGQNNATLCMWGK